MIEYKSELKKILLLTEFDTLEAQLNSISKVISEKDLANFFIDSIYLKSVIQYMADEYWIQSQAAPAEVSFDRFVKKFFSAELKPLLFLHSFFSDSNIDGLHSAKKVLVQTEKILLNIIKTKSYPYQKTLLQISLQRMSEIFELEYQLNSPQKKKKDDSKISLYRSFDILDKVFELDYILNETPSADQKERLYEGAGLGVQSSYATTLIAMRYLNLGKGSQFIDLGSGYGRIGLVVGLMRPDIKFIGYEYVSERVEVANKASRNLQLDQHVRFITQDLSDPHFKIPAADTYYIFDSFTDETYATIMAQLQELTQQRKITVVTKGNAKNWIKSQFWSEPQEFNDGNLCLFRSKARLI